MRTYILAACTFMVLARIPQLSAAHIYWTDGSNVRRAPLDGAAVETLVTLTNSFPLGVAVDAARGKVYWVNSFGSEILLQRANLDGTGVENLVRAANAPGLGWGRPHSLAIDETGAASGGVPKLYLGETDTRQIKRANLDGTGVEAIVSGLPDDSYALGIAVDTRHQKVYWANCCPDNGSPSISRANLDGSGLEEIALSVDPWGVALDLFDRKVYWVSRDTASVWRANLDGSQREAVVTNAGDHSPLALNRAAEKIYWADPTNLWQANLDGSGRQMLVPGGTRVQGIAVDPGLPPQTISLLPLTNVWKYEQNGTDLGTAWRETGYDDLAWPSGTAVLGLDDNPAVAPLLRTPLVLETNGFRIVTCYFRTHFHVEALSADYLLSFSNLVDDGAVFYLNGAEILRVNMPPGYVDWETRAILALPNVREGILEMSNVPSANLIQGDNVLAVEVHQANLDSTDIVFGMSLQYAPQTPLHITAQPRNTAQNEGASLRLSAAVSGSLPRYQWFKDDQAIPGATGESHFVPVLNQTDAGHYYLVAANDVSAVTSAVATVTVILSQIPAIGPPALLAVQPASDGGGGYIVVFDHLLDATSSVDPANYAITRVDTGAGVPILSLASYGGNSIRLMAGPFAPGTNYILTVNNVRNNHGVPVAPNSRASIPTALSFFSFNGAWKYNDSGNDLGTSWRESGFDDSAWASGPGLLYNDENFNPPSGTTRATLLNVTNAAGQSIVTHYFRRHFTLPALPVNARFSFRYVVDDGAVLYLNGQELGRHNMPAGTVNAATRARTSATEGIIPALLFDGEHLVVGDNVLAVEVHQFSLSSPNLPDISFAVEATLVADSFANTAPMILRQPENATVAELAPATFFADALAATHLQWLRNGVPISGAHARTLNLSSASALDNGAAFSLIASNSLGSVTSNIARLTVVLDFDPPQLLGANMGTNDARVLVTFSELLDPASASDVSRYAIANELGEPLVILSASSTNGTNVVLLTQPRTNGVHFVLTVDGVRDASGLGNTVRDQIPLGYEILHLPWSWAWRYDDTGLDLGTGWRESPYDDAVWPVGPGLLGFDDIDTPPAEPIRTLLPPPEFRGPVYYFRTRFAFTPHPEADAIWLRYFADDGAVFFLNGVEIHRIAVPRYQNYQTLATRGWEPVVEGPHAIARPAFLAGANVLAAEVHQVTVTSADSVFGAQLTEAFDVQPLRPVRPRLNLTRSGSELVLSWDALDYGLECAPTLTGPWQLAPAPTIPYMVSLEGVAKFYRLRR